MKKYRGMASSEAMKVGGDKRYFAEASKIKVAQGVVGAVVDRGSVDNFVPYLAQGLRHAFQDVGIKTLPELHEALVSGKLRMQIRSQASIIEGGVHDLYNVQKNPM